ncbi:MAG: hypothetical protein L3J71_10770 [Victivallaceae bacterium]|nr:hypothetical protein [Victivallaceae bacterium]
MVIKLSNAENDLAEVLLTKYEKNAFAWSKTRWIFACLALFWISIGGYELNHALQILNENAAYDVLKHIDIEADSSEYETKMWAVACIVKTAKIMEARQKLLFWANIELMIGFLLSSGNLVLLILIIIRWNHGTRDKLIARILREHWKGLKNENI